MEKTNTKVDISIAIMTYYHEKYVSKAIESVLSQDTSYSYEIVISDDCSLDGTRAILLEYKKKYPGIIRLNFNEKNIGITANYYRTREMCKGRYIASLSGDDYWIDNKKLQRQAEFLDLNPEYYAVATCIEGRYDNDIRPFAVYPLKRYRGKRITLDMYINGAIFGTNGILIRNPFIFENDIKDFSLIPKISSYIDDATECLLILMKGDVYVLDTISSVYRLPRNKKGKHNFNTINTTMQKCMKFIDLYNNFYTMIPNHPDLFKLYREHIAVAMAQAILKNDFETFGLLISKVPAEYRERGLVLRSIPIMFNLGIKKMYRLVLQKTRGEIK